MVPMNEEIKIVANPYEQDDVISLMNPKNKLPKKPKIASRISMNPNAIPACCQETIFEISANVKAVKME